MSNMNPEYDKYQNLRDALQRDVNSNVVKPISAEIFAKDAHERGVLKTAKSEYKKLLKNPGLLKQSRDQLIEAIVKKNTTPNWGSISLRV